MKSYLMHNRLPLIALLLLGLACSPMTANADDDDRGRHGYSQHERGKHHNGYGHHRDCRNPDYAHHHGNRDGYWRGYKHGYKSGYYDNRLYGHHHDRAGFLFGMYSDNLGIIFLD